MKKAIFTALFMAAILMVSGIAIATPGLKVHTDKNTYIQGEDVQILLVNEWHDYIGSGLGYYVTTSGGEVVWMTAWAQVMVMVPPGESLDYVWDQTYQMSELGDDFEQVIPGTYIIHANYGNSKAPVRIEAPTEVVFEIVDEGQISYYGYGDIYDPTYMVIKDDAAWTDFWEVHKSGIYPTPDKPYIDFSSEMIIVAIHGTWDSMGAGIEVESIYDNTGYLEVNVNTGEWSSPFPAVSNPFHIVKIPYSDQQVKFVEHDF